MTLKKNLRYLRLAASLKTYALTHRIVYAKNTGNWGDALIAAGQAKFFKHFKIQHQECGFRNLASGDFRNEKLSGLSDKLLILVGGGGAYLENDVYRRIKPVQSIINRFGTVMLMPSTYGLPMQFSGGPIKFWMRDKTESRKYCPNASFCHDMAFFLNPFPRTAQFENGYLFRTDRESPIDKLPENNRDLSSEGTHQTNIEPFFDVVGSYETIFTNRLHVGIAGALLGRRVHLFPNSYFKNKAAYEASLKPNYPNVSFHDCTPEEFGLV